MRRLLLPLLLVLPIGLPGLALAGSGSVVLKINVANPSEREPQTIPVKVHLPKEATPKDIKDLGDLKLSYDPEIGSYYVHGDVPLEAGQSITKIVTLDDIWVFGEDQIGALVSQAKEKASALTEPAAAQAAADMVQKIEEKVEAILKRQKETGGKPAERIQAYRQGITTITTIEQDLEVLDKLKRNAPWHDGKDSRGKDSRIALPAGSGDSGSAVSGSGDSSEAGAPLGRAISMTTAWRIILAILAFLGALSAVFFLTWHRLLRVTLVREHQAAPLLQGDSPGEHPATPLVPGKATG
jgi:hypothetical protein